MNVAPVSFVFVTALLCVCISASGADASCNASGIDTQIGLFRYGSKDPSDFDTFQHVIAARFRQMSYEFDKPGQPDISGLQLSGPLNGPPDPSAKMLKAYADANPQFLALWSGTIENKNDSKTAFSNIYLGRNGKLKEPEVTLSLPVTMQDVSNTIDTHSMVTYYALAINARSASCPANVVKAFLDKASADYQDLARRHYSDHEVESVGQAIKDLEKSRGQ